MADIQLALSYQPSEVRPPLLPLWEQLTEAYEVSPGVIEA